MSKQRTPWWVRLNRTLFYVMGSAQLGRADEPASPAVEARCPICAHAMTAHQVVRSSDPAIPTRLHCPVGAAA